MSARMENHKLYQRNKPMTSRSQPSSPLIDPTARLGLSPLRGGGARKSPVPEPSRKSIQSNDQTLLRGRWPSSSSSSSKKPTNSLADYLVRDGLSDNTKSSSATTLARMRSCSEFTRFEETTKKQEKVSVKKKNLEEEEEEEGRKISKENRPFGNSMRYISKIKFPKSSSLQPGRMSVDENTLASRRRKSFDFGVETPSSESDRSDTTPKAMSPRIPRARNKDSGKKVGNVTPSRSFSSLRPESPEHHKNKKVGNIISIGLDLFRKNKMRPSSPVLVIGDVGYQLRMLHNCLVQWRFVNARSDGANLTRKISAESTLMCGWAEIARMQASVMQKKAQLERERLNLKLNRMICWQMKTLEGWGDIERQHTSALSTTQNCLQAAVCRIPVVDRAKADPQLLSIRLRQATNLAATITTTLGTCTSTVQNTVPLLSQLALVVAEEKTLLEECLEMLGHVSSLQIQEESLKCHLVQLRSSQLQSNTSMKEIL